MQIQARIWVLRFPALENVFELNFETAPTMGLDAEALVADDYGPCQEFADRCRRDPEMPKAVVVPSAALPGTKNLVVFGPRVLTPYLIEPLGAFDVAGGLVADGAHPLLELVSKVRHIGEPHDELEAWKRGEEYAFEEPVTPLRGGS